MHHVNLLVTEVESNAYMQDGSSNQWFNRDARKISVIAVFKEEMGCLLQGFDGDGNVQNKG